MGTGKRVVMSGIVSLVRVIDPNYKAIEVMKIKSVRVFYSYAFIDSGMSLPIYFINDLVAPVSWSSIPFRTSSGRL